MTNQSMMGQSVANQSMMNQSVGQNPFASMQPAQPGFPQQMGNQQPNFGASMQPAQQPAQQPKLSYDEQCNRLAQADLPWKNTLQTLKEFGFTEDFNKNLELARKHKGDVSAIVADLTNPQPAPPQVKYDKVPEPQLGRNMVS